MRFWIVAIIIVLVCIGSAYAILKLNPHRIINDEQRLMVSATFYPLAEFTRRVGGDHVRVSTIVPAGVEPHDFEPTAQDIAGIYDADLFVFNGGGIDAWAGRIISSVDDDVKVIQMSMNITDVLPPPTVNTDAAGVIFDEHFWLDPIIAAREVVVIRDALIEIDPVHETDYRNNADAYIMMLSQLNDAYRNGLSDCAIRTAFTSHNAFAYMAREYDFTQVSITGLSPDEEPSAGDLAQIADTARSMGITFIFFEELTSPELSEALASEVGAQTLVFNPLEGLTDEQVADGKDYLTIMYENLSNLERAMACK
jgi:zinc transport system substrate-binding protein